MTDEQIAEQIAYYSSRAPEYEDWWHRRGVFDKGPEVNARWEAEAAQALAALTSLDLGSDALEVAPGTGTWTVHVAPRVARLTLVDGSQAMLDLNPVAAREDVRTVVADIFAWDTEERFDSVVFTFWISHVPRERLDAFFAGVARWLRPGGRVFFVDDAPVAATESHVAGTAGQTMVRRLQDGREATIVKNFYRPDELRAAADAAGIDLDVRSTPTYFQYATGVRRTEPD
ncbi:class I SAM-dependent methyltransferase [Cellulomonas iranensis]|uniref:class I SAM-dependent methyltransferase n=1 Tax=Cellulomonas iranensis TaxID=76862 RepID=UPI00087757F7